LSFAKSDSAKAKDDLAFGKIRQGGLIEDGMVDLEEAGLNREEPAAHGVKVVPRNGGFPLDAGNLSDFCRPAKAHGQQAVGKRALRSHEQPEPECAVVGAHAAEACLGNSGDGTVLPGAGIPTVSAAVMKVK
jgi:hypothetical protein